MVQYPGRLRWTNGSKEYESESVATTHRDRGSHMGNGMHEESSTDLCYFCNGLCSIGEDGFGTRRVASLCKLFGRHKVLEEKFQQLRDHSYTTDTELKGRQSSTQCKETTVVCRSYGCRVTGMVRRVYMNLFCC